MQVCVFDMALYSQASLLWYKLIDKFALQMLLLEITLDNTTSE